jgi:DNA (cytosine-5)-methyltransferase 1
MRALDLFCGAGGASRGLQLAGFHVTGVDLKRQPRYCGDAFVRADALRPPFDLRAFDLVWASPPCQRWTAHAQQHGTDTRHPDLIAPVRAMLAAAGVPYCIENVPRSPLRPTLVLTGCMFGLNTYRRRHFETSFAVLAATPGAPFGPKSRPGSVTITGHSGGSSARDGWSNGDKADWQAALGIGWMLNREMVDAVPPAYAEFIGKSLSGGLT